MSHWSSFKRALSSFKQAAFERLPTELFSLRGSRTTNDPLSLLHSRHTYLFSD